MPKAKTKAYTYQLVADEHSTSSSDIYTIQIRTDNRIVDELERFRSAVLTCNCRGWIFSKEDPRTCTHTRRYETALARFIHEHEQPLMDRLTSDSEPWLPEIREALEMSPSEIVTVCDDGATLQLFCKSDRNSLGVTVSDRREINLIRAVVSKPESHFTPFDPDQWLAKHPIRPRALPWAPTIEPPELLEGVDRPTTFGWADAVLGVGFGGEEPTVTSVNFGKVPKQCKARLAQFKKRFAQFDPTDQVEISWFDQRHYQAVMSVREFAAQIGIEQNTVEVIARALACQGVTLVPGRYEGVPVTLGSPYRFQNYTLRGDSLGGLTIDTRRHLIWFWPAGKLEEVRRHYLDDPAFHFEANCQHLVHIEFGPEISMYLDALNLATRCHFNVMPIVAVAAQWLLRANWPADACVDCYATHARQELICQSTLGDLQEHLTHETADDIWTLTESGRQLLTSVLAIEQILADTSVAELIVRQTLARQLETIGQLLPEIPPPDLPRSYGMRRAVRKWLGQVRSSLKTSTMQARLGADCDCIIPAWFAPVIA